MPRQREIPKINTVAVVYNGDRKTFDEGKIDVVLVKDLSRFGRHRTQTELFIDHLILNTPNGTRSN